MSNGLVGQLGAIDLGGVAGQVTGVLGSIDQLRQLLPEDTASLTAGLSGPAGTLDVSVSVDVDDLVGPLRVRVQVLEDAVAGGLPPIVEQLAEALSSAGTILEPVREVLTVDGTFGDLRAAVLAKVGDPQQVLQELIGHFSRLIPPSSLDLLEEFVQTIRAFEASVPTDPAAVASFFTRSFLGVPVDLLSGPLSARENLFASIDAVVDVSEVASLSAQLGTLAASFQATSSIVAQVDVTSAASYQAAISAVTSLQASVTTVTAAVQATVNQVTAAVAGIDLSPMFAPLAAALDAVPEIRVASPDGVMEILIEPVRLLSAEIDSLTPEAVTNALRAAGALAENALKARGPESAMATLLQPFDEIGESMRGLHLEAIRESVAGLLRDAGAALTPVTEAITAVGDGLVAAVEPAGDALEALDGALDGVESTIDALVDGLQNIASALSLEDLRNEAMSVIEAVETAVGDFGEQAADLVEQLRAVIHQVRDLDLRGAGQAAADAINSIAEKLDAVDVVLLPDPLVKELHDVIEGVLLQIDLEPVRQGLADAIAQATPGEAMGQFKAGVASVLDTIGQFSPGALLEPLEEPWNEVAGTISAISPGGLLDPVIAQLTGVTAKLTALNPTALVGPLDQRLSAVTEQLDALAPSTLLQPVVEPFSTVRELLDKLDPTQFLDELDGLFVEWLETGLGGLAHLGDGLGGSTDLTSFLGGISSAGDVDAEFGYRPGDILQPIEDLFRKVMSLLDSVPVERLVAALEHVRVNVVSGLDQLSGQGLMAGIQQHLSGVTAGIDFLSDFDLVAPLYGNYGELVVSFSAIDPVTVPAGNQAQHQQLASLVVAVNPDAALVPLRDALRSLHGAVVQLSGSVDVSGMAAPFGSLAKQVNALVPPFLRQPISAASIRAQLEELNPARLAAEINAAWDELMPKLLRLGAAFEAGMPDLIAGFQRGTTTLVPAFLKQAFGTVFDPVRDQILSLDPAPLVAELDAQLFAPIRSVLDDLTLEAVLGDSGVQGQFDELVASLGGITQQLTELQAGLAAPFAALSSTLTALSPSVLRTTLDEAFQGVVGVLAGVDLGGVADDLQGAFDKLTVDVDGVLLSLEAALDALIAAIPEEGVMGTVNVQVGLSLGI